MKIMHHQPPSIIKSSINWLNQSLFYFHNAFKKSTVYKCQGNDTKCKSITIMIVIRRRQDYDDFVVMCTFFFVFVFCISSSKVVKRARGNQDQEKKLYVSKLIIVWSRCFWMRSKKIAVLRPKHLQLILYSFNKTFF